MTDTDHLVAEMETLGEKLAEAKTAVAKRFIGQERVVDLVLSALLCGGHGLLIGLHCLASALISSWRPCDSGAAQCGSGVRDGCHQFDSRRGH